MKRRPSRLERYRRAHLETGLTVVRAAERRGEVRNFSPDPDREVAVRLTLTRAIGDLKSPCGRPGRFLADPPCQFRGSESEPDRDGSDGTPPKERTTPRGAA